jgi:hypothetical protein
MMLEQVSRGTHILMDAPQKEGLARMFVGFALNIPLYFLVPRLAVWSTIEREFQLSLLGGSLAIATLVFVTPVFWRGAPWQAPIAFALIFFLPGFVLVALRQY